MPKPGDLALDAELQIDHIRTSNGRDDAVVAVRCLHGPVSVGARFYWLGESAEAIDLELVRIVVFGREVDQLDPAHTALVTLRGAGTRHLRSGDITSGWLVLQGTNPTRSS